MSTTPDSQTLEELQELQQIAGIDPAAVFTPEETNAIEPTEQPTVEVLPQSGEDCSPECEREIALNTFEKEFNVTISADVVWGVNSYYFQYDGFVYYYKPILARSLATDNANRKADLENTTRQENLKLIREAFGINLTGPTTLDEIKSIIQTRPAGMGKFIGETETFYKFEDFYGELITIDNLTKEILDLANATFVGQYGPYYSDMVDHLFLKDDKLYFANLLVWYNKPNKNLGIFLNPLHAEKYDVTGKCFFFPFGAMTAEETDLVQTLGKLETDYTDEISIIYL